MATIQIKRGIQEGVANLVLAQGEMAVALDTGNVYIGTTAGKVHVNPTGGMADSAESLKNPREFSITGDVVAPSVGFNGTQNVILEAALATVAGLDAGTYTKLTVDKKGRVTAGNTITVTDLPAIPAAKITGLPSKVSDLTNDSQYQTASQVQASISALIGSAPEALDTLQELSEALGGDANFSTTITNLIGSKEPKLSTASVKPSIVDDDGFAALDSADSNSTKKITFSAIKSTLKTYFDTLYNNYVHPTQTAKSSGLYKITVDGTGHITAATAVTKSDITSLGIPAQDTIYTLPNATASVLGGVKVGTGLDVSSGVISVGVIDGGTF